MELIDWPSTHVVMMVYERVDMYHPLYKKDLIPGSLID